jgi:hypothetical protein
VLHKCKRHLARLIPVLQTYLTCPVYAQPDPSKSDTVSDGGPSLPTIATVSTAAEFAAKMADDNIHTINLGGDIGVFENPEDVTATRIGTNDLTIDFGSHILYGDFELIANNARNITFKGDAKPAITGNFTVSAGKATVTNNITVGGTITIADMDKP